MFAFNRSAFAVLAPIAMLMAVALFSNRTPDASVQVQAEPARADQTVAANLPSR